jgi:hypothetical protein
MLPIRLKPIKSESLNSYLCRLGTDNGWETLAEFLTTMKIKQSKIDRHCDFEQLARLTQQPIDQFTSLQDEFYQQMPDRMFYTQSPRFCPCCIQTQPFIKRHHHDQSNVFCTQHQCEIIDSCPCCQKPFEWNADLFTQCTHCRQKWSELSTESAFDVKYQDWIESSHLDQHLGLLHKAITLLIYPTDLDPLALTHKFNVTNQYIMEAFNLLQGKYYQLWHKRCVEDREYLAFFDKRLVSAPITELMATAGLPVASTDHIKCWPTFTSVDRIDKHPNITVSLKDRVSSCKIRQMLGLTAAQLSLFEDSGHFQSLYHVSSKSHKMYDMRQICAWLSVRMCKEELNYYRAISFNKLAMLSGIDLKTIIKAIYQGQFRFTLKSVQQQLTLMLAEDDVKAFISHHEVFETDEHKSYKWVARRLRIQVKAVKELVKPGLLAITQARDINRDSLSVFLRQYSTLHRFCYLHSLHRNSVEKEMRDINMTPILSSQQCTLLTHAQLADLLQRVEKLPRCHLTKHEKWVL